MADRKKKTTAGQTERQAANRDPITDEPGSHPVGTGVGAALAGAATGAAIGAAGAGPVGVAVGAAAGAVVGGLAGHEVAEGIDPTVEHAYWREHYRDRPYVANIADEDDMGYEHFAPAYEYGWQSYQRYGRQGNKVSSFDEVRPQLRSDWEREHADMPWDRAEAAARDAWDRVHSASSTPISKPSAK